MGPSGEGVVELALDPAVKYVLTVQPTPPLPNRSFPIQTSTKVLKKTKCEICTFTSTDSYGLLTFLLFSYKCGTQLIPAVHKTIVGGKKCPR